MTDANGAKIETTEYVPYGEMREHTGAEVTNYKFTDQELDPETGLYNYGARLYDPVIGRFITPDTIIPDVYDPQTLNRYSYCRNNPLIYVDPNGHMYTDAKADGGWEGADYGSDPGDKGKSDKGGKGDTGSGGVSHASGGLRGIADAIKGFIDGILGGMPNPSKQECPDDYTHRHPEKAYTTVDSLMAQEKQSNQAPNTPGMSNHPNIPNNTEDGGIPGWNLKAYEKEYGWVIEKNVKIEIDALIVRQTFTYNYEKKEWDVPLGELGFYGWPPGVAVTGIGFKQSKEKDEK